MFFNRNHIQLKTIFTRFVSFVNFATILQNFPRPGLLDLSQSGEHVKPMDDQLFTLFLDKGSGLNPEDFQLGVITYTDILSKNNVLADTRKGTLTQAVGTHTRTHTPDARAIFPY